MASKGLLLLSGSIDLKWLEDAVLGPKILLPIGCVYVRWINCVLLPEVGLKTQFFTSYLRNQWKVIFSAPVVPLSSIYCTQELLRRFSRVKRYRFDKDWSTETCRDDIICLPIHTNLSVCSCTKEPHFVPHYAAWLNRHCRRTHLNQKGDHP